MGEKGYLSDFELGLEWLLVPDGLVWVFQKQLIYWDFHAQPSLGLQRMIRKRENIQWASIYTHTYTPWPRL